MDRAAEKGEGGQDVSVHIVVHSDQQSHLFSFYRSSAQRVVNHQHDMSHTHIMESKLRPEMSVKPSHLWQHRGGYDLTSASLRGGQLLDHARGKKVDKKVFAGTTTWDKVYALIVQRVWSQAR
ncbi:hypothetical protein EON65_18310 [archaeon]|nr:MAG: hypothetical protein EON65_18310 [archaeon]